jgi:hypothetical protein
MCDLSGCKRSHEGAPIVFIELRVNVRNVCPSASSIMYYHKGVRCIDGTCVKVIESIVFELEMFEMSAFSFQTNTTSCSQIPSQSRDMN